MVSLVTKFAYCFFPHANKSIMDFHSIRCDICTLLSMVYPRMLFVISFHADVTPEFEEPDYSVPEDDGPVEVCVRVPAGQLEREVVISLLASGGTATGKTT